MSEVNRGQIGKTRDSIVVKDIARRKKHFKHSSCLSFILCRGQMCALMYSNSYVEVMRRDNLVMIKFLILV